MTRQCVQATNSVSYADPSGRQTVTRSNSRPPQVQSRSVEISAMPRILLYGCTVVATRCSNEREAGQRVGRSVRAPVA
jgi:hypothetical protein